jgi:hypothetical protein
VFFDSYPDGSLAAEIEEFVKGQPQPTYSLRKSKSL